MTVISKLPPIYSFRNDLYMTEPNRTSSLTMSFLRIFIPNFLFNGQHLDHPYTDEINEKPGRTRQSVQILWLFRPSNVMCSTRWTTRQRRAIYNRSRGNYHNNNIMVIVLLLLVLSLLLPPCDKQRNRSDRAINNADWSGKRATP